jgi:hypothetical protein
MTGATVPTLHTEHAITDFDTWSAAFARFDKALRTAGVRDARVHRPVDDPHFVIVDFDFDTIDRAAEFLRFLKSVVWHNPDIRPRSSARPADSSSNPPPSDRGLPRVPLTAPATDRATSMTTVPTTHVSALVTLPLEG